MHTEQLLAVRQTLKNVPMPRWFGHGNFVRDFRLPGTYWIRQLWQLNGNSSITCNQALCFLPVREGLGRVHSPSQTKTKERYSARKNRDSVSTRLKLHMRQTITEGTRVFRTGSAHRLRATFLQYFAESFDGGKGAPFVSLFHGYAFPNFCT